MSRCHSAISESPNLTESLRIPKFTPKGSIPLKLLSLALSFLLILVPFSSNLVYSIMTIETKCDEILTAKIMLIAWVAWLAICVWCSNVMNGVNEGFSALLTASACNATDRPRNLLPIIGIFEFINPHDSSLPRQGRAIHGKMGMAFPGFNLVSCSSGETFSGLSR